MARTLALSDLPDSLLSRILVALASPEPGEPRSDAQELVAGQLLTRACLVCRRWRDAVYSEPALWRTFTLRADLVMADQPFQRQAQWLAASFNLLRRVGQHVESFSAFASSKFEGEGAGAAGGWRLLQFLRLLHPGRLTALTIECRQLTGDGTLPAAVVEAVATFRQLSALHLGSNEQLPACTGAVLLQLSGLQRLRLKRSSKFDDLVDPRGHPTPWLSSIGQLQCLTFLQFSPGLCNTVDLTRLSQLHHLSMLAGVLQPPGLSAFPLLSSYFLELVKLQGVAEIRSAHCSAGMLRLDAGLGRPGNERGPLLPAIMSALLPAACSRLAPLTCLELGCCKLRSQPEVCPQLVSVRALRMCICFSSSRTVEAGVSFGALSALLRQVPALTELSLEECLGSDPDTLDATALPPGLTRLSLRANDLIEMPDGPYPEGLADLDLGGNELEYLPQQLAACTALTRLALDANEELVLTFADVHNVLAQLPRLARLELGAASLLPPRVHLALLDAHPELELSFTWGDTSSEGTSSSTSDNGSSEEEGSDADAEMPAAA